MGMEAFGPVEMPFSMRYKRQNARKVIVFQIKIELNNFPSFDLGINADR